MSTAVKLAVALALTFVAFYILLLGYSDPGADIGWIGYAAGLCAVVAMACVVSAVWDLVQLQRRRSGR